MTSERPPRLLRRIVDPVRRLCTADMPEPERWARISEVLEAAPAGHAWVAYGLLEGASRCPLMPATA